jgi:hypothetical protein
MRRAVGCCVACVLPDPREEHAAQCNRLPQLQMCLRDAIRSRTGERRIDAVDIGPPSTFSWMVCSKIESSAGEPRIRNIESSNTPEDRHRCRLIKRITQAMDRSPVSFLATQRFCSEVRVHLAEEARRDAEPAFKRLRQPTSRQEADLGGDRLERESSREQHPRRIQTDRLHEVSR